MISIACPDQLAITACGIDHDGSRVLLGTATGQAFSFDAERGDRLASYTLESDGDAVDHFALSEDGRLALACTRAAFGPFDPSYRAHLLDLTSPGATVPCITRVESGGGGNSFAAAALAPDGGRAVLLDDTGLTVWELADGTQMTIPLPLHEDGYWLVRGDVGIAFASRDVAAFTSATGVGIVDLRRRTSIAWLRAPRHACILHLVRVSSDGRVVTVSGPPAFSNPPQTEWEQSFCVCSGTRRLARRRRLPARPVWLSRTGTEVVCASDDGDVVAVDVSTGRVEALGLAPQRRVIAVSGNGTVLAAGAHRPDGGLASITCQRFAPVERRASG